MRIAAILLALIFPATAWATDYVIDETTPSVAGITKATTYGSLAKDFALKNAKIEPALLYVGEGTCESGVVIDKDSDHELSVYFAKAEQIDCFDKKQKSKLKSTDKVSYIKIPYEYYAEDETVPRIDPRPKSLWQTSGGIKISSTLNDLEKIYGSLVFTGLGWDYGGRCCFNQKTFPHNITLDFAVGPDLIEDLNDKKLGDFDYETIEGDKDISSGDIPSNIKSYFSVGRIIVRFDNDQ